MSDDRTFWYYAYRYLWGMWGWQIKLIALGVIVLFIIVLIIGNQISSCRQNGANKKIEAAKAEINKHIGENIVLEQNRNSAIDTADKASDLSQDAAEAVKEEATKDSSEKDSDFANLMRRFCTEEKMRADSNCKEYFGVK